MALTVAVMVRLHRALLVGTQRSILVRVAVVALGRVPEATAATAAPVLSS
jgi:hypothetical protein